MIIITPQKNTQPFVFPELLRLATSEERAGQWQRTLALASPRSIRGLNTALRAAGGNRLV